MKTGGGENQTSSQNLRSHSRPASLCSAVRIDTSSNEKFQIHPPSSIKDIAVANMIDLLFNKLIYLSSGYIWRLLNSTFSGSCLQQQQLDRVYDVQRSCRPLSTCIRMEIASFSKSRTFGAFLNVVFHISQSGA